MDTLEILKVIKHFTIILYIHIIIYYKSQKVYIYTQIQLCPGCNISDYVNYIYVLCIYMVEVR